MSKAPSLSRLYSTQAESNWNSSGVMWTGPLAGHPVDHAPFAGGLVVGQHFIQAAGFFQALGDRRLQPSSVLAISDDGKGRAHGVHAAFHADQFRLGGECGERKEQ